MMGQTHLAGGVALAITAEAVSHRLPVGVGRQSLCETAAGATPTGRMDFTLFDTAIGLDMVSGSFMAAVGIAGIAQFYQT